MPQAKPRVITRNSNNIQLIGDNVLYNNGIISAFYILPMMNYSTASQDGILRSITEMTSLLSGLASQRPNITFCIERIEKIVRAADVRKNLLESIKIYRPDYEMPKEFALNIKDDSQSYALLCIDIHQSDFADVEDYTLSQTIKQIFKSLVSNLTGLGNLNVDVTKILDIEKNIYSTIRHKCARASKELVFYNFVSKVFPCYEISYDELSYVNEENFEKIMGAITQIVTDNFGFFEMHNDGVDLFGLEPQITYGCMLDIKSFPNRIYSYNFPMNYPGCVTTIKCMKKEEAAIKLKRTRSTDRFELGQAAQVGAEQEQLEAIAESVNIATHALSELDNGEVLCQFNCNILVTSTSREELKRKIARIISDCKDRDILASKSLTQAADFLDHYVNLRPKSFEHFSSLQFPVSFQLNAGSIVGDVGSELFSPSIGESLM